MQVPRLVRVVLKAIFQLLNAVDFLYAGVLAVALCGLALAAPPLLAREYFGSWVASGTIAVSAAWAMLLGLFVRDLRRGAASLGDAALLGLATLFAAAVAFKVVTEAGAAA